MANCSERSVLDFPSGLFTREQLRSGFVTLNFFGAAYMFLLVALVCDRYFLPSVQCICEDLHMSQDVAGATFMAFATSAPELFTSFVGVFVTQSDIGVGTVVGSAIFNMLGIAACTGLAASEPIQLEWWPLTRDTTIYIVALCGLVITTWDDQVEWYEGAILLALIVLYVLLMAVNDRLKKLVEKIFRRASCNERNTYRISNSDLSITFPGKSQENGEMETGVAGVYRPYFVHLVRPSKVTPPVLPLEVVSPAVRMNISPQSTIDGKGSDSSTDLDMKNPDEEGCVTCEMCGSPGTSGSFFQIAFCLLQWPVGVLLCLTIPDCRKPRLRKFYPITFIMCVVWIAISSYFVSWMVTVIGDTFNIIDSVMGLTFLAAGGCLPEAISSVIMARKGEGAMGISNSLGANTLDVLLCLSLPWLLKAAISGRPTRLGSQGLRYSLLALLAATVVYRWGVVELFGRKAGKPLGAVCLVLYLAYITIAVLVELNFFGFVNPPVCE